MVTAVEERATKTEREGQKQHERRTEKERRRQVENRASGSVKSRLTGPNLAYSWIGNIGRQELMRLELLLVLMEHDCFCLRWLRIEDGNSYRP